MERILCIIRREYANYSNYEKYANYERSKNTRSANYYFVKSSIGVSVSSRVGAT